MRKNVLVIGNGFDLYHGLPTRYKDFLFLAQNWDAFINGYRQTDTVAKSIPSEKRFFSVRLGKKNEMTIETLDDYITHADLLNASKIDYLDRHLKSNRWIQYFIDLSPDGDKWLDFEMEMKKVLVNTDEFYNELLVNDFSRSGIDLPTATKRIIDHFSFEEADLSYFVDNRLAPFDSKNDADYVSDHKQKWLQAMKDELDELALCFCYYLSEFVEHIEIKGKSEQIDFLDDVCLLSFNYTSTYFDLYGWFDSSRKYSFVHGSVLEESIVLGISDDVFADSTDYVYFQKYFQRIQKRTGNVYREWLNARNPDETEKTRVFFMGHSFGESDKRILEELFNGNLVEKITVFHHSQQGYEEQVKSLVDLFGKEDVINWVYDERVVFEPLMEFGGRDE